MKSNKYIFLLLLFISISNFSFAQQQNSTKKEMDTFNTLANLHDSTKSLSVQMLFKTSEGVVRSLQINKDGILPEHITEVPAILICVSGQVIFEDEKGAKQILNSGEFYGIEPKVKHWVKGIEDSQLLLIK